MTTTLDNKTVEINFATCARLRIEPRLSDKFSITIHDDRYDEFDPVISAEEHSFPAALDAAIEYVLNYKEYLDLMGAIPIERGM